jgi:drug/metabolite transporter (DMT)-like permease
MSPFQAFLMVLLIIFWGSSFVVVKQLLEAGLTPIAIATFRFLLAGACFLLVLLAKKRISPSYKLGVKRKDLLVLLFLALIGVTFFFYVQYTGIQLAGATIAAILVCLLSPILIAVFSVRLFGEHLRRRQFMGIAVAVVGTLLVVLADLLNLKGSIAFLEGTLILILTPLMWAGYSLLGQRIMQKYDAFLIVAYVSLLGGLCLIPFSLAESSFGMLFTLSVGEWLSILYLSLTCSLLGYFIWFYVLKKAGAAATTFMFAEPLVTALFAVVFINEALYPSVLAGALLIFIGLSLVTFGNRKQPT